LSTPSSYFNDVILQSAIAEQGADVSSSSLAASMTITARGFGLSVADLLLAGDTIVVTSKDQLRRAFTVAFNTMQNENIGVIVSAEIVPWGVDLRFQEYASLNLITEVNDASNQLVPLSPMVRKANMVTNAQFALNLDEEVQNRMNTISMLRQCTKKILMLSDSSNRCLVDHELRGLTPTCYTVGELRAVLMNPILVGRKEDELNAYLQSYYYPCMATMESDDYNLPGGKIQTTPWTEMNACLHISCILPGATWNEDTNNCESSVDPQFRLAKKYCYPEFST